MASTTQVRLARRSGGRARRRHLLLRHRGPAAARRRPAAAAGRLPLPRPLHARPDERREVLRRAGRGRRRDRRRHGVRGRGEPQPVVRRGRRWCSPTPAGRRVRSATAAACASSTRRSAPISTALGVLGMPGFTAYAGLLEIGKPQPGETVVVAAATGPVGSAVGQIAKLKGARAVGIAGGDQQVPRAGGGVRLRRRASTTAPPRSPRTSTAAVPDGIDVYFENVGGPVLREVREADEPLRPDAGLRPGR